MRSSTFSQRARHALGRRTLSVLLWGAFAGACAQMPIVHDPSTVIHDRGRFYVFTTGRGAPILSSPDGYTWTRTGSVFERIPEDVRAGSPENKGVDVWAPDIIRVDGQFLLYYAVSSWGSFVSAVGLATNTTLDAKDPAYKWVDRGIVVQSRAGEDLNAIDPGAFRAPDGSLWLSYGSYHGTIQLVELDAKTGLRRDPKRQATVIASRSESSDIIAHDGYFYLFVNHGSCCQGKKSGYNLRVGRSRHITGPYLDKHGQDMAKGGGSLFLAGSEGRVGPGHFGRVVEANEEMAPAERFSLHYEAADENNGRPTLDIRPLLWSSDDWPIAGDHLRAGKYVLRSAASEDVLDLHVEGTAAEAQGAQLAPAKGLRMADYTARAGQQWRVEPSGAGYFKVLNAETGEALQISGQGSSAEAGSGAYTGADNQLWQVDQLPDATYRLRNKQTRLVIGCSSPTPAKSGIGLVAAPTGSGDEFHWMLSAP